MMFLIGFATLVIGVVLVMIYACIAMAGRVDKEYERRWEEKEKLKHRKKKK